MQITLSSQDKAQKEVYSYLEILALHVFQKH